MTTKVTTDDLIDFLHGKCKDEGIRRFIEAEMARDGSPIQTWFEKLVEARKNPEKLVASAVDVFEWESSEEATIPDDNESAQRLRQILQQKMGGSDEYHLIDKEQVVFHQTKPIPSLPLTCELLFGNANVWESKIELETVVDEEIETIADFARLSKDDQRTLRASVSGKRQQAIRLRKSGELIRALVEAQQAAYWALLGTGSSSRLYADCLLEIVLIGHKSYQHAEMEPLLRRAHAILMKRLDGNDTQVMACEKLMCNTCKHEGRLTEGLTRTVALLEKQLDVFGDEIMHIGDSVCEAAWFFGELGEVQTAKRILSKAVNRTANAIDKKRYFHLYVSLELANVLVKCGELQEAFQIAKSVLDVLQSIGRAGHGPLATSALSILGAIKSRWGEFEDAEKFLLEASTVSQQRTTLHANQGTLLAALARLYGETGRYEVSSKLRMDALTILKNTVGTAHPYYWREVVRLARGFVKQGELEEAEEQLTEAIEFVRKYVDYRTILVGALIAMGRLREYQGRSDAARDNFEEAQGLCGIVYGTMHPRLATVYECLAGNREVAGEFDEALEFLRRATDIYQKSVTHNLFGESAGRINRGSLFQSEGDFKGAEAEYQAASQLIMNSEFASHPLTALCEWNVLKLTGPKNDLILPESVMSRGLFARLGGKQFARVTFAEWDHGASVRL